MSAEEHYRQLLARMEEQLRQQRQDAERREQQLRQDAELREQQLRQDAERREQQVRQDAELREQQLRHEQQLRLDAELREQQVRQAAELREQQAERRILYEQQLRLDAELRAKKLRQAAELRVQQVRQAAVHEEQQLLLKRKTTRPLEALTAHLAEFKDYAMRAPSVKTRRRAGNIAIETQINTIFSTFKMPENLQDTKDAALIGASGVGKTFTALTYPTGAIRREYADQGKKHITFYTGFNSDCPPTGKENHYLIYSLDSPSAIAVVVLGRLLVCLTVALKNKRDLERSTDTDVHNLIHTIHCNALLTAPEADTSELLRSQCTEKLVQLEKELFSDQPATGKEGRLTVLVNVDEAQYFDEKVPKEDGAVVGARHALKCLRKLQLDVSKATNNRVIVLGLATGINPKVSLTQATDGTNVSVSGLLTAEEHFWAIARMLREKEDITTATRNWDDVPRNIRVAAALTYPRVRAFISFYHKDPTVNKSIVCFPEHTSEQFNSRLRQLLEWFVMKSAVKFSDIPEWCVHNNETPISARLFLDMPVWNTILDHLSPTGHFSFIFPSVEDVLNNGDAWQRLEATSGRVLYIILLLFFQAPERSGITHLTASSFRKNEGAALGRVLGIGDDEQLVFTGSSYCVLGNASTNRHPFSGLGSHEDAAGNGLSDEFSCEVKEVACGQAMFFCCGNRAPFDYILLRRTTEGEVHLSYIDAKHSEKAEKATPEEAARRIRREMESLLRKACIVHPALTGELGKRALNVSSQYTVTIITNLHVDPTVAGVICPTTFSFSPLTNLVYETLPANLNEEEEECDMRPV